MGGPCRLHPPGPIMRGDLTRLASGARTKAMKTSHWTVVVSIVGLAAAATGPALHAAEPCPAQCASGKVPLGVAVPLSGAAAAFGKPAARAVEIAVAEINK